MNPANPQQPNAATTRTAQHRQVLSPLNYEARRSPERARQIVTQVYVQLQADIDAFTAPPDIWHNFAILADRIGMEVEESLILRAGLREWDRDVDLLCDHLQNAFNSGSVDYNPTLAAQYWERLEKLPRTVTAPYWRFWTFGAQYHMRITRDLTRAKNLLDEGLLYVQRDGLQDILRSYRALLVDSEPLRPIRDEQDLIAYQEWAFSLLENRYRLGLRLGFENAYVLAGELAKLYQERAGANLVATPNASQAQPRSGQDRNEDLEQALAYLKLAEALYTGNSNHPIQAIYQQRVYILMALGRYNDALHILQALPGDLQAQTSNTTMRRLAILVTGGRLDEGEASEEEREEIERSAILGLFESSGENLLAISLANPGIAQIVVNVAQQIIRKAQGGEGE